MEESDPFHPKSRINRSPLRYPPNDENPQESAEHKIEVDTSATSNPEEPLMFAVPSESFGGPPNGFYLCMKKDDALVLVDLQFWYLDSSGELVSHTEQTTLLTVPEGEGDSDDGQFDIFNEILATLTKSHDVAVTMSGNIKDLLVPVKVASLAHHWLPISLQLKKNTKKNLFKLCLLLLLRIYQISSKDHQTEHLCA
jgi:hypothetical protein